MICISLAVDETGQALHDIERARSGPADCIELRLDPLGDLAVPLVVARLVRACGETPVIATCRPVREGGVSEMEDGERLDILSAAAAGGATWIDIEAAVLKDLGERKARAVAGDTRIIASFHDFEKTPDDLAARVSEMERLPCDVVKFAVMATRLADILTVRDVLAACETPAVGLAMGELGEASRVLALHFGSILTFGAPAWGAATAPGQPTVEDLADLYRVRDITDATDLYCVVGDPVAHSVSPEIHNTAFRELGMDACYLRFRVDDLHAFLRDFECLGIKGVSVTIPHKHAALEASTQVDSVAERIGAVNTLTRDGGGWKGDNTDWQAAVAAIAEAASTCGLDVTGAKALVLGAGGAARGIAWGLREAGCRVTVANRTREKAERLAKELDADTVDLAEAHEERFDIVANSTSVGMHPFEDRTPVDAAVFRPGMVAFDAVYNPRETRMLSEARARGAAPADGIAMFVGQAERQFEIWTGREAPHDAMEAVVVSRLTRKGPERRIDSAELDTAVRAALFHGGSIGDILAAAGVTAGDDACRILSQRFGIDMVDLDAMEIESDMLETVTPGLARTFGFVPLEREGRRAVLAFAGPPTAGTLQDLRVLLDVDEIDIVFAAGDALSRMLDRAYPPEAAAPGPDAETD